MKLILEAILILAFWNLGNTLEENSIPQKDYGLDHTQLKQTINPLLWKVSCQDNTKGDVYILGSIHLAFPEIYPLPIKVMKAFSECKAICVELDPENTQTMEKVTQIISSKGLSYNSKLSAKISEELFQKASEVAAKFGIPASTCEYFEPWMLATTLTELKMTEIGMKPEYGIDRYFIHQAMEAQLDILEMETPESQLSILYEMDSDLQNLFLEHTLLEILDADDEIHQLFQAWKKGDLEQISSIIQKAEKEDEKFIPLMNELFEKRNIKMVQKIITFINQNLTVFVIVGAGHLSGESGILKLLEKSNLQLQRV